MKGANRYLLLCGSDVLKLKQNLSEEATRIYCMYDHVMVDCIRWSNVREEWNQKEKITIAEIRGSVCYAQIASFEFSTFTITI